MRSLLIMCSFLCISAVAAETVPVQSGKTDSPTSANKADSKVVEILTEDDLLAYQARLNLRKPRINLSEPNLVAQVAVINKYINDGIMFSELTGGDLRKVQNSLKHFSKLGKEMDASTSDTHITPDLLAEQDKVNAMLDKAQKDSVYECYSTMTTGSHFTVRKCRTVAQLRRMRERDQNGFQRRIENRLDASRNGGHPGGASVLGNQ